ncbi:RNA polymerase sigma factor [Streptomyces sp. DH37]|uniref:RNA polymerase sigma factor n=1 Tax=Streptomyces sp. DH37 TaxID=3040122 RepID=UPI00244336CF|nr:hypothetical protein [Streptomyces sp. DH37]MDG9704291.1 hypothetical protein [Streptomyces sp. DH37]
MTRTLSIPAPTRDADAGTGHTPPPAGPPSGLAETADLPHPAAADGPAEAFDLLYARLARPLLRQAFLLTGDRSLAERSVRHAFRLAWERWPEVAVDRDPAGWVRAAAYDHALSPWHRLDPRRRAARRSGPERDGSRKDGGALPLEALLDLPPSYRRTLLLHDGLGLELSEAAAESEASTAATAARLMHAREALAEYVPGLRRVAPDRRREIIRSLLAELADAEALPEPPSARAARDGSEHLVRLRTGAAFGATALVAAASLLTALTGPQGPAPAQQAPQKAKAPAVSGTSPDGGGDGSAAREDRAAG